MHTFNIYGADVALLVTTGRSTGPARQVTRQCRIALVDRPAGVVSAVLSDRARR
ncbi:PDDEXK family nuclease [Actinoplanes siamensis]|uniref:Uncharacterized protein n=1 Tax=Actinoplanes siamensis TaxID=1223317 RepID=A0A919NEP0_9ACTN|nr:hypothetical protein [Actinoplanes siamensis]GIF09897.1 hypothetical protein Asi03nite_74350 [Actinoplanes siamensis]